MCGGRPIEATTAACVFIVETILTGSIMDSNFLNELATVSCGHLGPFLGPYSSGDSAKAEKLLELLIPFRKFYVPARNYADTDCVPPGLFASWLFHYHSLGWTDVLRRMFLKTNDSKYKDCYIAYVISWLKQYGVPPEVLPTAKAPGDFTWYDMAASFRVDVMIGLFSIITPIDDVKSILVHHLTIHKDVLLKDNYYAERGNHALHQNNALLSVGMFFNDENAVAVSIERLTRLLAISVDQDGVCLEGAVAYHAFNAFWWSETLKRLQFARLRFDYAVPFIPDMRYFLAHCIAPDGHYVPLGDTFIGKSKVDVDLKQRFGDLFHNYLHQSPELCFALTCGLSGHRPTSTLAVFKEGFCFSRIPHPSDPHRDSMCSIRFGAGLSTRVHAHDDGGSVTYYPYGVRLIEDGGMYGYYGGENREFVKSPLAHNVITSLSKKYYRSAINTLTHCLETDDGDLVVLTINSIEKTQWTRKILHHKNPSCLLVEDIYKSNDITIFQNWNFEQKFWLVNLVKNRIDVESDTLRASCIWLCNDVNIEISSGRKDPFLGWASRDEGEIHKILSIQASVPKQEAKIPVLFFPFDKNMDFEQFEIVDYSLHTRSTKVILQVNGKMFQLCMNV